MAMAFLVKGAGVAAAVVLGTVAGAALGFGGLSLVDRVTGHGGPANRAVADVSAGSAPLTLSLRDPFAPTEDQRPLCRAVSTPRLVAEVRDIDDFMLC